MDEFIPINPQNNYEMIADDFLGQLVNNHRQRRWLECWPLKEAFL